MRSIRIAFQIVITILFIVVLVVLILTQASFSTFVAALGLFGLLLFLTLLLKFQTELRLNPQRRLNLKIVGWLIVSIGLGSFWMAWLVASGQGMSSGWRGQRVNAIIEMVGPWPPSLFFAIGGLIMLWVGVRVLRS